MVGDPADLDIYREEKSSNFVWQMSAVLMMLTSAYQAQMSVDEYDELTVRNIELTSQHKDAITQAELDQIEAEYGSNQEEMKTHKQNVTLFTGLAVLAAVWETYLFFSSDDPPDSADAENATKFNGYVPRKILVGLQPDIDTSRIQPEIRFRFRW